MRQSSDYIPKMIELAGGKYIFEDLGDEEGARSTVNMQIEDFYQGAKDADYLIYNSTIDGGVSSIEELIDKCEVLKDFKAVKNGDVWCTTNDMYGISDAGYPFNAFRRKRTEDEISFSVEIENRGVI